MSEEKLLDSNKILEDIELSLRPQKLKEFIGQSKAKENLEVFINAAIARNDVLDHVLLYGPPGLGKTTIAQIIAKEMGKNFRSTSGPILSKAGDLAAILTNLEEGDILFIDEIHRLNTAVEEVLYSAMEDFTLDILIGEGPAARTVKIDLPKFTLVGATTRIGLLSNPLRDRFGIPTRLIFYDKGELSEVIKRGASVLDIGIEEEGSMEIASRSRGTPRIALRLLRRVRDFAYLRDKRNIDKELSDFALTKLEVDAKGLDSNDHRYLKFIAGKYNGGPVGVETISAGLSEQRDTIEETIEPYLLQQGFIQRTPRGRVLSNISYSHMGMKIPKNLVQSQLNLKEE